MKMFGRIPRKDTLREVVLLLKVDLERISKLLAKEYLNKKELAEFKILIEKYWEVLEIALDMRGYGREIVYEVFSGVLNKNAEELKDRNLEKCKVCNSELVFDEHGVARCVCGTYYYRNSPIYRMIPYMYMKQYNYSQGKRK